MSGRKGIGSHQSAAMLKDEWLTPPPIIDALGPFDLDPCAPVNRPWPMAEHHFTAMDDGLSLPWFGRVWCNPPYGLQAADWLAKCVEHRNATALIFARTETEMFFKYVWDRAAAVLFLQGRLHFHHVNGERAKANAGAPSVLVAFDNENAHRLRVSRIPGKFIALSTVLR